MTKDGVEVEVKLNSGTSRGTDAVKIEEPQTEVASQVSTETVKVEEYDSGFPKIERKVLEELGKTPKFDLPVKSLNDR